MRRRYEAEKSNKKEDSKVVAAGAARGAVVGGRAI
jgi:hypothetical protein